MIKLSRKVLCLDWDKRSLRIVLAKVGGGQMELEDAHAHLIPTPIDADDPEALGPFIAQMLQKHRISTKQVIVDVARDRAVINRLTVPPTPRNELAAAVRFQAMRELPFPVDDAHIDFVVLETNENNLAIEVLLAAVRRETLEKARATCTAAGLTPTRIGLRPYASLIAVNNMPAMLDRRVLFVDVGPTTTEIDVLHGRILAFSRAANVTIPIGREPEPDEELEPQVSSELSDVLRTTDEEPSAVRELIVEISRTLQAFRAAESNAEIDQVVIGGGTGIEHTLLEACEKRFGMPVMLFDPTATLGVSQDDASKLRAFASTLGLAWGVAGEGTLELDFLNPKKDIPRSAAIKRRATIYAVVGAVAILIAAGAVVKQRLDAESVLSAKTARNNDQLDTVKQAMRVDFKRLEADEWDAKAREGVWLDHFLTVTQALIEPGKKLLVSDLDFNLDNATIQIKLLSRDGFTATEFVKALNEYEVDGVHLYRAEQGAYQKVKTIAPETFEGKVTVTVRLLQLTDHKPLKDREREYKQMEREIG